MNTLLRLPVAAIPPLALLLSGCATAGIGGGLTDAQVRLARTAREAGATRVAARRRDDGGMTLRGRLEGQRFALAFPPGWNGDAALFAHGYSLPGRRDAIPRDPGKARPIEKDDAANIMSVPYAHGVASGLSAYEKGGIAIRRGAENTIRLKALVDRLGARRVYLTGGSMGGSIVMAIIDKHPGLFAGAMTGCGVTDSWTAELEGLVDLRAVYGYFTQGTKYALHGGRDLDRMTLSSVPPAPLAFLGPVYQLVQLKRASDPVVALMRDAAKDPHGQAAAIVAKVASVTGVRTDAASFVIPLTVATLGYRDMRDTFGGNIYGNADKIYHGDALTAEENAALNRGVDRIAADPAAIAYAADWHASTGRFDTPLLAIHNAYDPLVPHAQAEGLARKIAAAGNQANAVQRTVPAIMRPLPVGGLAGYAHCGFTHAQIEQGWAGITGWVETGRRPAGN